VVGGGEFPVAVSGLGVNSLFDPFGDISIVLSWSLLGCGGSFFLSFFLSFFGVLCYDRRNGGMEG